MQIVPNLVRLCKRFFTNICCSYEGDGHSGEAGFCVSDNHLLWYVNQRAKLSSLGVETASNSFHLGMLASEAFEYLLGPPSFRESLPR